MDPERIAEPYEPTPGRRVRWPLLLLAGLAAAAGALLAPETWPEGEGRITVEYRDTRLIEETVSIGETEPVVLRSETAQIDTVLELAEGLPIDGTIEASLAVEDAERVEARDLSIVLTLSDGREEPLLIQREDETTGAFIAARRPPVRSAVVLGVLGMAVVLWVSEALPVFVTSLAIPVVLVAARAAEADEALAPFFDPVIALFFGGFLMAEAMRRVSLDRLAATAVVARAGRSPVTLFAAMIGLSAFLSMWMSNTAAAAVLLPVALAITAPLEDERFRKVAVLGIAYAATLGGVGSAIGTPANPLAIRFLDSFAGRRVSFAEWFGFGLPMVALFLPIVGIYLWKTGRARVDPSRFAEVSAAARAQHTAGGRPTRDQAVVLGVFAAVMAAWLTETWHGVDTGIVAIAGAIVLAVLGRIRPDDLGRISWTSLITFGGGLTLGVFLVESGTSDWVAARLGGLAEVPSPLAVAAIAAIALGLTTVASNTATAAMLIPLAIPLAGVLGVDPVRLVVVVAIASSIDFALVIGTPPTMLAYSTQLFTTREIFRRGIALDILGLALLVTAVVGIWNLLGLI